MFLLLLQAGDIETNPDPENAYKLSILHLNIRSIGNKLDFILDNFSEFTILCFPEMIMSLQECFFFRTCTVRAPYRKDRTNHVEGGCWHT